MKEDFLYPTGAVDLPRAYVSSQGFIQNLREGTCGGVALIESKAGAIRSNHYHKTDSHLLYVVSGIVAVFERPVGSDEIPEPLVYGAGRMFYTPAMLEHATLYLVDTTLISISERSRDHANHEEDVVRVEFITQEIADGYMKLLTPIFQPTDPYRAHRETAHCYRR